MSRLFLLFPFFVTFFHFFSAEQQWTRSNGRLEPRWSPIHSHAVCLQQNSPALHSPYPTSCQGGPIRQLWKLLLFPQHCSGTDGRQPGDGRRGPTKPAEAEAEPWFRCGQATTDDVLTGPVPVPSAVPAPEPDDASEDGNPSSSGGQT